MIQKMVHLVKGPLHLGMGVKAVWAKQKMYLQLVSMKLRELLKANKRIKVLVFVEKIDQIVSLILKKLRECQDQVPTITIGKSQLISTPLFSLQCALN